MPWITESTMSLRLSFVKEVEDKQESVSALCRKYNISRTLGYRYLARYKEEGETGLIDKACRPHHCPQQTPVELEELIVSTRKRFPDWGARKIHRCLSDDYPNLELPSLSTLTTIFKRHNLVEKVESQKRQALGRFERATPNELWQMDYKGSFLCEDKKRCFPFTVLDDHSRFSLAIKALPNERGSLLKGYLEDIFREYGLPLQINVDNGNPWGTSNLAAQYTQFNVWLLHLGIKVTHSRPSHPQTNGKIERFHRSLKQEVLKRQTFNNFEDAQTGFDQWRDIYNYQRPHQALNMEVPAIRYKPSPREFTERLPAIEYEQSDTVLKVGQAGYIYFNKTEYNIGKAFRSLNVAIRPTEIDGQFLVYFGQHVIKTITFIPSREVVR